MIVKLKEINQTLGWVGVVIGTLVLIGWWEDFLFLQHLFPELFPMRSATALCFIITGLSIASVGEEVFLWRLLLRLGLLGVFLTGLINITNYLLHSAFYFDDDFELLLKMSLASGTLFCILSVVLLNNSLNYRHVYKVNVSLILFGMAVSLLAITGYILDYHALYTMVPFSTMAPHTAVTFILLFAGAFAVIRNNPILELIAAGSLGGNYARTILPVGLLMPILLGFLLLGGVRLNLFSLEAGFILLVFLSSLIITIIVYQKSKLIHKIDIQKQKMVENMRLLNQQLGRLNEELRLHELELNKDNKSLLAEKETLTNTNETLDTFVHAASHDLKSPVQNMKALHQLMHVEEDENMKQKYLEALESSTHRLDNTINGLMGIVALQSNQQANIDTINFQQLLDIILADCVLEEGDEVVADFTEVPEIVYVKPYLQSILRNLVTNAIKYRDRRRSLRLEISTKRVNTRVMLTVKDNGIGIDLEKHGSQLFQPFKRFSEQAAGSGIGLHLIKGMIEKNGGNIRVESHPGRGTTFYCELIEY